MRCALLASLGLLGCRATESEPAKHPNVVLIVMDDLHYDDLGCFGSELIETPNVDQLAAEGIRLTQFYTNSPVCSPTRASILTGRYPHRFNIEYVCRWNPIVEMPELEGLFRGGSFRGIPGSVETLAGVLKGAGYATLHAGKWHLGIAKEEFRAVHHGFDESLNPRGGAPGSLHHDNRVLVNGERVERAEGPFTEYVTDRVIDFIRRHREGPFFVNLWHLTPHLPLEPEPEWAARFPDTDEGRLAAMVGHADETIGRLLAALDEMGLREDTLVIFTSDNGGLASSHPHSLLRGNKGNLFEGGIRVPLIARWPGKIPAGAVDSEFQLTFDLLPTIAELAGAEPPTQRLDGRSFAQSWLGAQHREDEDRTIYWEYGGVEPEARKFPEFAVRRGDWKLVSSRGKDALFQIRKDPTESNDVAAAHPDLVSDLRAAYGQWRLVDRRSYLHIETTRGNVDLTEAESGGFRFGPGGGVVVSVRDPLLDVHDGHLSIAMRVDTVGRAAPSDVVLAEKKQTWRLTLRHDERIALLAEAADGTVAELVSQEVSPSASHHVAFVVRGSPYRNSRIELYVDGRLQAVDSTLESLRPGTEVISLGGGAAAETGGFVGALRDVRIYLMDLMPSEVAHLASAPADG